MALNDSHDLLVRIDERVNAILEQLKSFATHDEVTGKIENHNFVCEQKKFDWKKIGVASLIVFGLGNASGASIVEFIKSLF